MREKTYTIKYRQKGNVNGDVYETSLTARNLTAAKLAARKDLENIYTIVSVKLDR